MARANGWRASATKSGRWTWHSTKQRLRASGASAPSCYWSIWKMDMLFEAISR